MKWIEVRIRTTPDASDAISEMLGTMGSGGVAIEDPYEIRRQVMNSGSLDYAGEDFLASLRDDVLIRAYFQGDRDRSVLGKEIEEKLAFISAFLDTGRGLDGLSDVDEDDWANAWKQYYKPVKISERIVVKPSWEEYHPADNSEIIIEIDPGMAFGTGTHETTRMCLEFLDTYVRRGDTVLDIGCGTGILSVASAKLGADHVTAVDIDDTAVRVAGENCRINRVDDIVKVLRGELSDLPKIRELKGKGRQKLPEARENHGPPDAMAAPADIMAANIIASVISAISADVRCRLKPGGIFIASGIIRERAGEVVEAYAANGFEIISMKESGEWVAIAFRCPDFS